MSALCKCLEFKTTGTCVHIRLDDHHAQICADADPCPACGPKLAPGQSLEEFCDLYQKFS